MYGSRGGLQGVCAPFLVRTPPLDPSCIINHSVPDVTFLHNMLLAGLVGSGTDK